jgi:hypothetical protein
MMQDLRDRNDKWIGFIDPYVVYKDTVTPDPNNQRPAEMERNLRRFLYNQRDIGSILFPYNMGVKCCYRVHILLYLVNPA